MITIKNNIVSKEALDLFVNYFKIPTDLNITIDLGQKNELTKTGNEVFIFCEKSVYVFRMLTHLINAKKDLKISEKPLNHNLTYYCDCSRNGVVNFEFFKKTIYVLAATGYNRLSLYTEDTYEVDNEPYFGHMRGRYSQEEIRQMVAFAEMFDIELIPAISTLAHLDNIFFWSEYEQIFDIDDIILLDDERTYRLINNMFASLAKCYKSREVHIGFDEAHHVCLGRYFDKHGAVNRTEVVLKHLNKVIDIAKSYGFTCTMWSDMFFRLEYNQEYYVSKDAKPFSQEILKLIPKDVKIIYWDYYHIDKDIYINMIKRHESIGNPFGFAGGSWNWLGYAPLNAHSFERSIPAIQACKEMNVNEIIVTAWGDNGNECSRFAVLPTQFLYGEYFNTGKIDDKYISKRMKQITGLSLEDFMVLDLVNERPGNEKLHNALSNPAKYIVYNDPLNGVFDFHISEQDVISTKKCLNLLKKIKYKGTMCEYLFDTEVALCNLIIDKAMIGNDIYKAYHENNKEEIVELYSKRIPSIIKKYKVFYEKYRYQWNYENKSIGLEVIQGRLSYQFFRLEETKRILKDYCSGKLDHIEELDQPKLSQKYPWEEDKYVYKHCYKQMPNVFMNK